MSNKKKISLDDIFNDDEFGLLDSTAKASNVKTADQRLIDSFERINAFIDKNSREPNASTMTEYSLLAHLKNIRENEQLKIPLLKLNWLFLNFGLHPLGFPSAAELLLWFLNWL